MTGSPKVLTASATVEVPFHDVDAMNVCWHGHYLKYFEIGRAALLRTFDYDYREMQASGYLWPASRGSRNRRCAGAPRGQSRSTSDSGHASTRSSRRRRETALRPSRWRSTL